MPWSRVFDWRRSELIRARECQYVDTGVRHSKNEQDLSETITNEVNHLFDGVTAVTIQL